MSLKYGIHIALATLAMACSSVSHHQVASSQTATAKATVTQDDALVTAVKANDLARVSILLAEGADPNILDQAGLGALHYAAALGNLAMTELLVEKGAPFAAPRNSFFPSALHMAAQAGAPPHGHLGLV